MWKRGRLRRAAELTSPLKGPAAPLLAMVDVSFAADGASGVVESRRGGAWEIFPPGIVPIGGTR